MMTLVEVSTVVGEGYGRSDKWSIYRITVSVSVTVGESSVVVHLTPFAPGMAPAHVINHTAVSEGGNYLNMGRSVSLDAVKLWSCDGSKPGKKIEQLHYSTRWSSGRRAVTRRSSWSLEKVQCSPGVTSRRIEYSSMHVEMLRWEIKDDFEQENANLSFEFGWEIWSFMCGT